jgi:hypothetical protein
MQYMIFTPGVSGTCKIPLIQNHWRSPLRVSKTQPFRDGARIIEADCLYGDTSTSTITSFLRRNQSEKGEL